MSIVIVAANRKHPWEQIIEFVRKCPDHRAFKAASREFGLHSKFIRNKLWRNYGLTLEKIREGAEPSPVCEREVPGKPETKAALEYIIAHPEEKLREVAGKFGCHPKTLGRLYRVRRRRNSQVVCRKAARPKAANYKPWKRTRKPEMVAAVAHTVVNPNDGIGAAALRYGVHRHSLSAALKTWRATNRQPGVVAAWVIAHPEEGIGSVAARFGVSKPTVVDRLKRAGMWVPHDPRRRKPQAPRALPPPVKEAVERFAAHPEEPISEIAAKFGVPYSALLHRLKSEGQFVPHDPRRRRPLPSKERCEPILIYAKEHPGEAVAEIAAKFGVNRPALKSWLRRAGIKRQKMNGCSSAQRRDGSLSSPTRRLIPRSRWSRWLPASARKEAASAACSNGFSASASSSAAWLRSGTAAACAGSPTRRSFPSRGGGLAACRTSARRALLIAT